MFMLMVFVVVMAMFMFHRLMQMRMSVLLGQMQPQPDPHQSARDQQSDRQRFVQHEDCEHGADKRGERKIGSGPRCTEMAQSEGVGSEADAVAEKADHKGASHRSKRGKRA